MPMGYLCDFHEKERQFRRGLIEGNQREEESKDLKKKQRKKHTKNRSRGKHGEEVEEEADYGGKGAAVHLSNNFSGLKMRG